MTNSTERTPDQIASEIRARRKAKKDNRVGDRHTVKTTTFRICPDLIDKLTQKAKLAGYPSVNQFVVSILTEVCNES